MRRNNQQNFDLARSTDTVLDYTIKNSTWVAMGMSIGLSEGIDNDRARISLAGHCITADNISLTQ